MCSEADDLSPANRRNHRFVPDFFTGMDVGEVDFNGRDADGGNRVPQSNTGVGVGGRIQNNRAKLAFRLLNPIHQFAFQVGLAEVDFGAEFRRLRPDCLLDVSQRLAAVNLRLALSDEVQIRSVEKQDLHRAGRGYLGLGSVSNRIRRVILAPQPTQQQKEWPGQGRDVEAEFNETLQGQAKNSRPDRKGHRTDFSPISTIKYANGAENEGRISAESDESRIRSLLQVIVVGEFSHLRGRCFEPLATDHEGSRS